MGRNLTRQITAASVLIGGSALAAGCSDGGDGAIIGPPPQSPPAMGAERFGTGFALSFRASANSDPREPMSADVIPASITTDPLDVP
ncbi:hypothetical protein IP78_13875 [Brevundimonas sp. AAP58]|uniref:hypothetical protein n=1 Tax=Brevundimonas sp. AAP58 TaxID=1523422 RepID=UPI0006B94167|nr:hypothetical protein [Brevundimonas sp. AAP58]KPF75122.1 hypothetical protein IP78_13875 [Brevundimonas sp. AAP58]